MISPNPPPVPIESKPIWTRETPACAAYARNRIPGMIVTSKRTVLIYNEARMEGGDWARMDIFLQRSTDHGATFGEPIYLARGSDACPTVNNPVMVEDNAGTLHFLYCENYGIRGGKILHRTSTDDGITWSEPADISRMTLPYYRNAFALGPGHGICTKDGTLVFAVWLVPKCYEQTITSHSPSVIGTLYSRDNGVSWQIGELLTGHDGCPSPNETTLALTEDDRIYLNARIQHPCRAVAYSKNGYNGWSPLRPDKSLRDPMCFGSTARYRCGNTSVLLFANCDCETARKNVTVRVSFNDGATWQHKKVLDAERGGYVEIAVDNAGGLIYVLYETDWGKTCRLAKMTLDELVAEDMA